jgi:hypothetical protein
LHRSSLPVVDQVIDDSVHKCEVHTGLCQSFR